MDKPDPHECWENHIFVRGVFKILLKAKMICQSKILWRQCNTNIKIWTEYEYEYIHILKFYRIRISNIFVLRHFTEYEYRIYLFLYISPNTNIEYIHFNKLYRIRISNNNFFWYSNIFITNIRISSLNFSVNFAFHIC